MVNVTHNALQMKNNNKLNIMMFKILVCIYNYTYKINTIARPSIRPALTVANPAKIILKENCFRV